MSKKTVIAMAVAGALSIPFGSVARDSVDVSTPLSVNEAGEARVQRQDDRSIRDHRAFIDERSWQVQTPLSIPEAGAADSWPQHAADRHLLDRDAVASIPDDSLAMSSESAAFDSDYDAIALGAFGDPSSSERSDTLALADQGFYSDYYLIGVPQTADYYVLEVQPAQFETQDVVFVVPVE